MNKFIIFVLLFLSSCGGGTSGSSITGISTEKAISGTVSNEQGEPIVNAKIEIDNDSQDVTTDQFGQFSFATEIASKNAKLKVNSQELILPNLLESTSSLRLDISLTSETINAIDLELALTDISGTGCENAFSSIEIFQLSNSSTPLLISDQVTPTGEKVSCRATIQLNTAGSPAIEVEALMYFVQAPLEVSELLSFTLISQKKTDAHGKVVFDFIPNLPTRGPGYFVIEVPSSRPSIERLAVVINTLKE